MDTFNYQEYLRNNPLLENLNEEMGDVKAAWPKLTDDQKIDLLTGVWDDPDEAEKHFEKDFDNLPEAAKQNMYMDMMRSDLKEEEGEEEGWVNFNKASSNIENVDKEETFGIGNMKQAYNVGHYIGRTYRNRKTISQEKEKGWKDLLRSYDPPVKDTTSENLNEVDVEREAGPVVDQYFTYIMNYFNTHHDDIYDMNNFLTALKHVTTTVTATRDRFAQETGHDGLD